MRYVACAIAIFCCISVWQEKNRTIPLAITRRVNAWYRDTKDVDSYAEVVRSGWDMNVLEKVMLRGA